MLITVVSIVVLGTVAAVFISWTADASTETAEDTDTASVLEALPPELAAGLEELGEQASQEVSEAAASIWRKACEEWGLGITDDSTDAEIEAGMEHLFNLAEETDFESIDGNWICCMDGLAYELEARGKTADFFFEWIEDTWGLEALENWYTSIGDTLQATDCHLNSNFFFNVSQRIEGVIAAVEGWFQSDERWWN